MVVKPLEMTLSLVNLTTSLSNAFAVLAAVASKMKLSVSPPVTPVVTIFRVRTL